MILHECANEDTLAQSAAAYILGIARESIKSAGAFHLALSGGSTPRKVYGTIANHPDLTREIVEGTHLYFVDERNVPAAHADSNVGLAKSELADPVGTPAQNFHAPNGGARELHEAAAQYEKQLMRLLPHNAAGLPVFDLVWLGMGADGHTASLFPRTEGLEVTDRVYIANQVPQLGTWRLTLTFDAIRAARSILVLATGENKAPIMAEVFGGTSSVKYPIQRLCTGNDLMVWMIDRAAASLIPADIKKRYGANERSDK